MSVPFTQYLRPDGRTVPVQIDLDPAVETKAQAIIAAGYRFEIEMLSTGEIHATITGYDPAMEQDGDVAQIVCPNGPGISHRISTMIMDFAL